MSKRRPTWGRKDTSKAPLLLAFRSSKGFIVTACCTAVFTDMFLYSIVVPVLPFALTARVGIPPQDVQRWTSALLGCYAGALVVASPICGWLADRFLSRRLPFVLGLLALGGSTVLLCVGSSIGVLVLGRLLEGLSGAIIWTSGPALLVDTVGQKEIGKVMGYYSLSVNVAVLLGPVLGGIVFAQSGYLAVFAMAFGLLCLDVVLRLALVEKKVAAKWSSPSSEREDYWISNYDTEGPPSIAPSSKMRSLLLVESLESMETYDVEASIVEYQAVSKAPTTSRLVRNLPPVITILHSRRLLAALWGSLVQAATLCALDAVLPLFVRRSFGWSSTGAGLIFLTISVPSFAAPAVGWVADKYGPRWPVVIGFSTSLPFLVLLRLVTHDTLQQIVLLCVLLTLLGMSQTLIMGPLMAEIAYLVEAKEKKNPGIFGKGGAYAQTYGLYFCWFAGGLLVGPIWAGFVVQRAGWGTMTWSLGLLSGVTVIPTLIFTGGLITRSKTERGENRGGREKVTGRQQYSPQRLGRLKPPVRLRQCPPLHPAPFRKHPVKVRPTSSYLKIDRPDSKLDNLHQRISALSPRFLGYPVNQRFDYTELFRFLYFSLNNVGDPFRTSNFRLNSHDIERDVIQIFKYLAGGSGQDIWGYITSGGTEGNIYGLYLARELLPHGIVYFSEDTHYSVAKALRMLQIRGIKIRSQGNGEMDYDDFRRVLNLHRDAPAIVLANIGTTMKGAIDSLPTIQGILEDVGISKHYIHCDAALSGMILPFVDSGQPFGFDHGVDSLAISGHKMIGSPVPCGVVLAKRANVDRAMTNEWVQYVDIFDTTLMGSRSGFAPLLLWHALTSVEAGEYTLKTQVHHSLTMAEYTVRSLRLAGIPAWRHKNSLTVVFPCPTQAILRKWQLATYQDVAHLVTMPNVTRELIDAFVRDMSLGNIEAEPGNA